MTMLRLLLALFIVVLPNALRFWVDTGIPAVNLTNLLFVLLCMGLLMDGRDPLPMPRGRLTAPLIFLIVIILIGFVIAQFTDPDDLSDDIAHLKSWVFYPLLYFVYRRSHQDLHGTRQLIFLTLLVVAVAGLEAIVQGLQLDLRSYSPTERATGPFGELGAANRAGVFYAIFLPTFLAIAVFVRDRWFWRLAALTGCAVLILAIMVTFSRQAYLIGLIGAFLLLFRRNTLLAVALGALMAASVALLPQSVMERVVGTQQTATGTVELDGSTASRFHIWDGAIGMWRDHPGGVGLNRFKENIGEYSRFPGRDAHNSFVLILAELGPLGLAALLWLFWRLWGLARRILNSSVTMDPETAALALGFTIAVISLGIGNLFSSYIFEGSVMGSFWILCGLLERYVILKEHAAAQMPHESPVTSPVAVGLDRFPLLARIRPGYQGRHL